MAEQTSNLSAKLLVLSSTTTTKLTPDEPVLGIQIKADKANTGTVWIGNSNVSPLAGYPLDKGETIFLPVDNADNLFAVAGVNNDKIYILRL